MTPAIAYYVFLTLVAFVLMGLDKLAARAGAWRVPERVFFGLALFGGGGGIFAGMLLFHHKTRKPGFILPACLATVVHIAVVVAAVV